MLYLHNIVLVYTPTEPTPYHDDDGKLSENKSIIKPHFFSLPRELTLPFRSCLSQILEKLKSLNSSSFWFAVKQKKIVNIQSW